jgi:hypothetical protein
MPGREYLTEYEYGKRFRLFWHLSKLLNKSNLPAINNEFIFQSIGIV